MKNVLLFFSCLLLTGMMNGQNCNDLIVTEIVFGNVGGSSAGENTQFNHSVEVFNPTDSPIDLSNYSIELVPESGAKTIIELEGIVPSEDVFVISNVSANSGITSVSDVLDLLLSFDGKVAIQLAKTTGEIIDKVGRQGVESTSTTIDFAALLNDPNYLNSFDINLGSIQNLLIRRSRLVQKGSSQFDNNNFIQEWAIYPNFATDDLGFHKNACLVPILAWDNIGSFDPDAIRDEFDSNPVLGTVASSEELAASVDIYIANVGHEFFPVLPGATSSIDFSTDVDPFENITLNAGDESVELELLQVIDDFEIEGDEGTGFLFQIDENNNPADAMEDFNSDVFDVLIRDDESTSTQNLILRSKISVFPTIADESINIAASDNIVIERINVFGISSKEFLSFIDIYDDNTALDISPITSSGRVFSLVINARTLFLSVP